jgi:hypothetical protein
MDFNTLKGYVQAYIRSSYETGEGVGGSGHMASLAAGLDRIEKWEEVGSGQELRYVVVAIFTCTRESEFGGESTRYKKRFTFSSGGDLLAEETLETKVTDLLTGEENDGGDIPLPPL